jgi:hypothetical protein
MDYGLCVKICLDDTDGTFVAFQAVLLLVLIQSDEDGDLTIHGADGVGISSRRFCHDALKRGRKTLQQEQQRTVKQQLASAFGDGEIQLHIRPENSDSKRRGV